MKIAREVLSTFRGFSSGQAAILNGPLEAGHKCCSQAQRETPKKLHPRGPTALSVMLLLFLILLGMVYPHPTPTPTPGPVKKGRGMVKDSYSKSMANGR